MTPVFAHGHLRLYLLSLLAERPMHGYELIQALSDRFGGTYIPSAGTIYPRLAKLGEEGLVSREADGRKTVYSLTEAGRAELVARQSDLDEIERGVTTTVRSLADEVRSSVADAMRTLKADLAAAARETATPRSTRANAAAPPPPEPHADEPTAGRHELKEVEHVLAEFRNAVRADLRAGSTRDILPAGTAERLRRELDEVRARVMGAARGD